MGQLLHAPGDVAQASRFNQQLAMGAAVQGMYAWCGRVKYNGTSWEVDGAYSSAGITTGALAWNATSEQLEITLSDFASRPIVTATPVVGDDMLPCKANADLNTLAFVQFYDKDTGAPVTAEAVTMDFNIIIMGNYVS